MAHLYGSEAQIPHRVQSACYLSGAFDVDDVMNPEFDVVRSVALRNVAIRRGRERENCEFLASPSW